MPIKPFVMTAVRPEVDLAALNRLTKQLLSVRKSMYTDVEIAFAPSPTLCYD